MGIEKQLLRPVEIHDLIRLGHHCDGGYVVPKAAVDQTAVLLSLGLNDEWSFEEAFLARNPSARLVAVDGSVGPALFTGKALRYGFKVGAYSLLRNKRKLAKNRHDLERATSYFKLFRGDNIHIKKMVGAASAPGRTAISELIRYVDPRRTLSVFLKMDIEGAEYDVVGDILENARFINCIAAEIHHLDRRQGDLNAMMRRLQRHFYVVHVHGNNFVTDRYDGFPPAIELTLLNKAMVSGVPAPSRRSYPLEGLDFPNYADRPEAVLSFE